MEILSDFFKEVGKYCSLCGKKSIKKATGRFDIDTGEPYTINVCPDGDKEDCLHNHEWQLTGKSIWYLEATYQCKKCKKIL